ncbi:MAG: hypothetical protein U0232_26525 [Thermomicrobiales bacterium]
MRGGRSRARRKPPLVIAALLGQTAWLDGQVRWQDGRLAWVDAAGSVAPGGGELALAERRLRQLEARLHRSQKAVPEHVATLARRRARFALAQALVRLDLGGQVWPSDEASVPEARAVALLVAEAHCLDALPVMPSRATFAAGTRAMPFLDRLLAHSEGDALARALAALVRGALGRRAGQGIPEVGVPWLRRACAWGLRHGLPTAPALLAALLEPDEGMALARRYLASLDCESAFVLPPDWLRGLLARGLGAEQVVALGEAAARLGPLAERVMAYRDELPDRRADQRQVAAELLRRARQKALGRLVAQVQRYAWQTGEAAAIVQLGAFVGTMLDLQAPRQEVLETIEGVLAEGLELPDHVQAGFLGILAGEFDRFWDRDSVQYTYGKPEQVARWLAWGRTPGVSRVRRLLERTGDAALVGEATRKEVVRYLLDGQEWDDPAMYRWLLVVLEGLRNDAGALHDPWFYSTLFAAPRWFADEAEGARYSMRAWRCLGARCRGRCGRGCSWSSCRGPRRVEGGEAAALRLLLPQVPRWLVSRSRPAMKR